MVTEKWCRRCWRENGTAEISALYPDGNVPQEGWRPLHCWSRYHGVECIRHREGHGQWFINLLACLYDAGAMQVVFNFAFDQGWNEAELQHWCPLCDGRKHPGITRMCECL